MSVLDPQLWFKAVAQGDIAAVRSFIVEGIDIDQRDDQERTAFHVASQRGHTDIMNTILAARQMNYLRQLGLDPYVTVLEAETITDDYRRHA